MVGHDSASTWHLYQLGNTFNWKFNFAKHDVHNFIKLSTDNSPIHIDPKFAHNRGFNGPILHGALIATQLSRLIGKELPDQKSMTIGFSIEFLRPAYEDDDLIFSATLINKSEANLVLEFNFSICRDNIKIASGRTPSQWAEVTPY